MLKLEKGSRDSQICVTVRDKDRIFTNTFLKALSIALGIHFGLLAIFQIAPFKLRLSEKIFPPVLVEADSSNTLEGSVLANIEAPRLKNLYLELPPPLPTLQSFPTFIAASHVEFRKEESPIANPFSDIEKEMVTPDFKRKESRELPSISLVISGNLGNKKLEKDPLKNRVLPAIAQVEQTRAIFSVLVENRTGSIFWYEPKQLTGVNSLDRFAESIVKDLSFIPETKTPVVAGEVELHFNYKESKNK